MQLSRVASLRGEFLAAAHVGYLAHLGKPILVWSDRGIVGKQLEGPASMMSVPGTPADSPLGAPEFDNALALMWRAYMAGFAFGFATGRLNIAQTLLSRPDATGHTEVPLRRSDLLSS